MEASCSVDRAGPPNSASSLPLYKPSTLLCCWTPSPLQLSSSDMCPVSRWWLSATAAAWWGRWGRTPSPAEPWLTAHRPPERPWEDKWKLSTNKKNIHLYSAVQKVTSKINWISDEETKCGLLTSSVVESISSTEGLECWNLHFYTDRA